MKKRSDLAAITSSGAAHPTLSQLLPTSHAPHVELLESGLASVAAICNEPRADTKTRADCAENTSKRVLEPTGTIDAHGIVLPRRSSSLLRHVRS